MSVDYNTFVGPYIEVYNPKKDFVYEYYSCPKKGCKNHNKEISSKFCPECGKKIELTSRLSEKKIEFNMYEELDEDKLTEIMVEYPKENSQKDFLYFISNCRNLPGRTFDCNYTEIYEIAPDVPGMEINNFQLNCKEELAKLRKIFEDANVKVKWGVLIWCS